MKLVSIPANPAPDDAVVGALQTPDGVTLRYARFAPPPGRKGTVVVLQGRAEFIEKYFETVRDLRARGFAVATLDWRGQGLSQRALGDPHKGYVRKFSEYGVDLDTFMNQVVLPDCPPPFFLLAHSMGGAVAIEACFNGRRWFDRVVLTAPMIGLPKRPFFNLASPGLRLMRLVGRGSGYIPKAGQFQVVEFIGNPLTSDPVRFARNAAVLEEEPALRLGGPTVAWAHSALAVMRRFEWPNYAGSIRQPMLIAAAGQDDVVSTSAIEEFGTNLLAGSHIIVPGARHEILQEQDLYRKQFWAAFDAFVPGTPLY
jgi:lysophospholipase